MSWREQAACVPYDGDIFFADKSFEDALAKKICGGCPVRDECLADAFATGELWHGIRGGLTPRERRSFLRRGGVGRESG
jgi:WhiB family transcriptional regulator, redox-sensing transcriptional regulator